MSQAPLFSIIIPIYNVEKYLNECVDSVLKQSFSNFEVILVDDESPDNCPTICDEYTVIDSRVRVIHKKNGGLSDARNAGIKIAIGDYIIFLDSDDKLANGNVLSLLHEFVIRNKSKIIFCPKLARFSDSTRYGFPNYLPAESLSPSQLFDYVHACGSLFAAWLFVTNSHVIHEKNLYFTKGILHEDMDWIPRVLSSSDDLISVFPNDFYLYRFNNSSITSSFTPKRFESLNFIIDWITKLQEIDDFHKKWLNMLIYSLYVNMSEEFYENRKLYDEHLKKLISIMKDNYSILNKRNKLILIFCSKVNALFYKLRSAVK